MMARPDATNSLNIDNRVFHRTNSVVLAPFLTHIVVRLLKNANVRGENGPIDETGYIDKWGGGLNVLRECYKDWDKRVDECCKALPVGHSLWRKFVNVHNIPGRAGFDDHDVLIHLLQQWVNTGKAQNMFGPYPSPYEQDAFQNINDEQAFFSWGQVAQAIVDRKFEKAYTLNNASLASTQKQSTMTVDDDDDDKDDFKDFRNNIQSTGNYNTYNIDPIDDDPFDYGFNDKVNNNNNTSRDPRLNFGQDKKRKSVNQNFTGYRDEPLPSNVYQNENNKKGGILYYQTVYFTKEQLSNIATNFRINMREAPKVLFGENDVDHYRSRNKDRMYWGGQAEYLGKYDRSFGYGIVTTWKPKNDQQMNSFFQTDFGKPDIVQFKRLMDEQFKHLFEHIANGKDVIIPSPTEKDLRKNPKKYFGRNYRPNFDDNSYKQRLLIRHNLGTGIANLAPNYIQYIQLKLDELAKYASEIKTVNHPVTYGNNTYGRRQRDDPFNYDDTSKRRRIQRNQFATVGNDTNNSYLSNLPFETDEIKKRDTNDDPRKRIDFNATSRTDHYSSMLWKSPQKSQESNQLTQRGYGDVNTETVMNNQMELFNKRRVEEQQQYNTPARNRKYVPHYKSPTGMAEIRDDGNFGPATPSRSPFSQSDYTPSSSSYRNPMNGGFNNINKNSDDIIKNTVSTILRLLFFFPRKIYIYLCIQNKPHDAFKIFAILCGFSAVLSLLWNGTDNTFIALMVIAIIFAVCGIEKDNEPVTSNPIVVERNSFNIGNRNLRHQYG